RVMLVQGVYQEGVREVAAVEREDRVAEEEPGERAPGLVAPHAVPDRAGARQADGRPDGRVPGGQSVEQGGENRVPQSVAGHQLARRHYPPFPALARTPWSMTRSYLHRRYGGWTEPFAEILALAPLARAGRLS